MLSLLVSDDGLLPTLGGRVTEHRESCPQPNQRLGAEATDAHFAHMTVTGPVEMQGVLMGCIVLGTSMFCPTSVTHSLHRAFFAAPFLRRRGVNRAENVL